MVSWEAWSALLSVYFFICRVSRASAAHDSGSMVLSVALRSLLADAAQSRQASVQKGYPQESASHLSPPGSLEPQASVTGGPGSFTLLVTPPGGHSKQDSGL